MSPEIKAYYKLKEPLINKSISDLFPEICTDEWLKKLTGGNELSWDTQTLQLAFLNPIHSFNNKKENYLYSLGGILFLEAGDIDPENYLPLIAISEIFETCFRVFNDVAMFNAERQGSVNGLPIQDAINANVGVALLTLPYYPLLYNTFNLPQEIRLRLFQNGTKYVSRVLYANGTNLYRKKSKIHFTQFDEYAQNAFYLHGPKLLFNFDLWLFLSNHYQSKQVSQQCEELTRIFALSYQLQFDLNSFKNWIESSESRYIEFDRVNNFILLHISKSLGVKNLYKKPLTRDRILEVYTQSAAEKFIAERISHINTSLDQIVKELPFGTVHKNNIRDYIQLLLDTKD